MDVNGKKRVKVRLFLHPNFSEDDIVKAILHITAEINPALLMKLLGCCKRCWVQIDTEVMDKNAGKSLSFISGPPHTISTEKDKGQVNFHQDLVTHDELRECLSKSVGLTVTVTFITAPIAYEYITTLISVKDEANCNDEDKFVWINKV